MENIIKITQKKKITSIRISESTKRELESFGNSGNSHEEIIKKLIRLANSTETKLIKDKNIIGTKYGRLNKTFNIETEQNKYSIVCKFNDLSLMNLLKNKELTKEWEMDLEIVNIGIYSKKQITWKDPDILYKKDKHEYLLLYLVAVKQVLEEVFSIKIYEINIQNDYFDIDKWRSTFLRNKLSMESFYKDIQKKIK